MKWNLLYQITAASRLGGYRPHIPVLYILCPQLNLLNPPEKKFLGTPLHTTATFCSCYGKIIKHDVVFLRRKNYEKVNVSVDVIYRIYRNVLYFENVTGLHVTRVHRISFTRICKVKPKPFLCQFLRNWKILNKIGDRGSTVVKVLCYKSEGLWFDSRRSHWNFSLP